MVGQDHIHRYGIIYRGTKLPCTHISGLYNKIYLNRLATFLFLPALTMMTADFSWSIFHSEISKVSLRTQYQAA